MIISQWKSVRRPVLPPLARKSVDPGNCDTVTQVKLFSVLLASQCTSYTIANCSKMVWRRPQSRHYDIPEPFALGRGTEVSHSDSRVWWMKSCCSMWLYAKARANTCKTQWIRRALAPRVKAETNYSWLVPPTHHTIAGWGKKNIPNGNRNLESTSVKNIQRINLTSLPDM